eukprot:840209-Amphidinium_carterae.1
MVPSKCGGGGTVVVLACARPRLVTTRVVLVMGRSGAIADDDGEDNEQKNRSVSVALALVSS